MKKMVIQIVFFGLIITLCSLSFNNEVSSSSQKKRNRDTIVLKNSSGQSIFKIFYTKGKNKAYYLDDKVIDANEVQQLNADDIRAIVKSVKEDEIYFYTYDKQIDTNIYVGWKHYSTPDKTYIYSSAQRTKATQKNQCSILCCLEKGPLFQGQNPNSFSAWVRNNISIPEEVLDSPFSNNTMLSFVVDTTGRLRDVKIVNPSIYESLNAAAYTAIVQSPRWEPASCNGHKYRVRYSIPFRIITNVKEVKEIVGEK